MGYRPIDRRRRALFSAAVVFLAAAAAFVGCASDAKIPARRPDGATLRVASLNIHYLAEGADTPAARWGERGDAVVQVLREIDADIVAFQEMETFSGGAFNRENRQADTVNEAFPGFAFAATGDPRRFPNTQPVLYRRARFAPLDQGYFFFSPEPQELYSDPWFGRYPSFGTWVRLQDRSNEGTILVVNVHIDRSRYRNQIRSARLVASVIDRTQRGGDKVVVLGDFNAFRWMAPVRIVSRRANLKVSPGNGPTFHFYRGTGWFPAIDHILVSGGLLVAETWTVRSRPDGVWPSDHYPIAADLVSTAERPVNRAF